MVCWKNIIVTLCVAAASVVPVLGQVDSCVLTPDNTAYFTDVVVVQFQDGQEQVGYRLAIDGYRNGIFTSLQGIVQQSNHRDTLPPDFSINQIYYYKTNYTNPGATQKQGVLLRPWVEATAIYIDPYQDLAFIPVTDSMVTKKAQGIWKRMKKYPVKQWKKSVSGNKLQAVKGMTPLLVEPHRTGIRAEVLKQPSTLSRQGFKQVIGKEVPYDLDSTYLFGGGPFLVGARQEARGVSGAPIFDLCDSTVIGFHLGGIPLYSADTVWEISQLATGFDQLRQTDTLSDGWLAILENWRSNTTLLDYLHFFETVVVPEDPYTAFDFQPKHSILPEDYELDPKPWFIRSVPAAIDQFYQSGNARSSLEKLEKGVLDTTIMHGLGKGKERWFLHQWNLKRIKKCYEEYDQSVTMHLYRAARQYGFLEEEIRLGNFGTAKYQSHLDSAKKEMGAISQMIYTTKSFVATSPEEERYWKEVYRNPEYGLDSLMRWIAKDLDRFEQIGVGMAEIQRLKQAGQAWEALQKARELQQLPVREGRKSFRVAMEKEVQALTGSLMESYQARLDTADTLAKLEKYVCAERYYEQAQELIPNTPYPKQQLAAVRKDLVAQQNQVWIDQVKFELSRFLQQLSQEYDPRNKVMLPFNLEENYTNKRLQFTFDYGLQDGESLVNLIAARYPVGVYWHPGLEQMSNMVSDMMTFLEYRFGEIIDWKHSNIGVQGHADGIPYRGKIRIDQAHQGIFSNIDNEKVYNCDPLTGKSGKSYRLFKDLRKGNSDDKNRALAFQRAYFVAQVSLQGGAFPSTPDDICAIIHQQRGGQYRKIEIDFDIQLDSTKVVDRQVVVDTLGEDCSLQPRKKRVKPAVRDSLVIDGDTEYSQGPQNPVPSTTPKTVLQPQPTVVPDPPSTTPAPVKKSPPVQQPKPQKQQRKKPTRIKRG